ncbi:MAG: hypothetical protein EOP35_18165 [Rubrivivax sp.]|nr:MAG: hypothetical protein EOP35_18165 [Rubrivivax sp.]
MKHVLQCGALAFLMGCAALTPALAADEKYSVSVAFDASFDAEGRVTELRPHKEAEHPAALWANLKPRLLTMKVPPVVGEDGQPATFRTGLYLSLEVEPGDGKTGQIRIKGLKPSPLVLVEDYFGLPRDVSRSAGWTGDVEAECTVGIDGRCGEVKVKALPGIPHSVLKWANATLGLWRFQPPEINGKPIPSPVRQSFSLSIKENAPDYYHFRRSF